MRINGQTWGWVGSGLGLSDSSPIISESKQYFTTCRSKVMVSERWSKIYIPDLCDVTDSVNKYFAVHAQVYTQVNAFYY